MCLTITLMPLWNIQCSSHVSALQQLTIVRIFHFTPPFFFSFSFFIIFVVIFLFLVYSNRVHAPRYQILDIGTHSLFGNMCPLKLEGTRGGGGGWMTVVIIKLYVMFNIWFQMCLVGHGALSVGLPVWWSGGVESPLPGDAACPGLEWGMGGCAASDGPCRSQHSDILHFWVHKKYG